MNKKMGAESTFDRLMKNKKRRENFEKGYNKFLISEFILEAMEENHISVRKLAEKANVSPAIIQNLRTGKTINITLKKLNNITNALGYRVLIEKAN